MDGENRVSRHWDAFLVRFDLGGAVLEFFLDEGGDFVFLSLGPVLVPVVWAFGVVSTSSSSCQ